MHPVIKILSLIILSVFSTQGGWSTLLLTGAVVLPFYFNKPALWNSAGSMIWRLKWLFLSILLIYVFFTPKVSASLTQLNPYVYMLLPGIFRVLVLINLILAVNLLIKTTHKDELLTALLWIFYPLRLLHIDIDRFLLRAVLTIEYIEILNLKLTKMKERIKPVDQSGHWLKKKRSAFFHQLNGSITILQELFAEVSKPAEKEYLIDTIEQPGLRQWSILLGLLLFFSFASCQG
jgi:energy-coupling factor transport system permease protein